MKDFEKTIPAAEADIRIYYLEGQWQVLVGKTDAANDYLSLRLAQPNDYWFHIHGMPGSHVILKAREDMAPDRKILAQAGAIAAYHSKARNAGSVFVSWTRARDVSKPRGARPGTVRIRRQSLIKVRPALPPDVSGSAPSKDTGFPV